MKVLLIAPVGALRLVATKQPVHNLGLAVEHHNETSNHVVYRQRQNNFANMQYYGDFQIGTPGQTLSGIFDTGSFDLLVLSEKCSSCPADAKYDPERSSSYEEEGTVQRHCYGSGCADTVIGFEKVDVGPLREHRQAFWEIIHHQIAVMDFARFQAIVGVGHSNSPSMKYPTMLQSYGIDEFAFCLEKGDGAPGWLYWGAEPYLHGQMAAIPVVGKHHWGAVLKQVGMRTAGGYSKLLDVCRPSCGAIIDSGTSLIGVPKKQLKVIEEEIGHVNQDCSNIDALPTLTLNLGGHYFELPPRSYVVRTPSPRLDTSDYGLYRILTFQPKVDMVTVCMHAFFGMDQSTQHGPMWILGDPWLRTYYTIYNRANMMMYAAPAGADCRPQRYLNFVDEADNVNVTALHLLSDEIASTQPAEPVVVDLKAARNPWSERLIPGIMEI
mmetsp:Transcript_17962/g.39664  ORF Transcript_17962/g.39664 Transcript_17962/m.39664 type:complete len:439 (+) Transcript_17962:60-1376(+)